MIPELDSRAVIVSPCPSSLDCAMIPELDGWYATKIEAAKQALIAIANEVTK